MNINTDVLDELWRTKRDLAAFSWIINDLIECSSVNFGPMINDLLDFLAERMATDSGKIEKCADYLQKLNKEKEQIQ